MRRIREKGGIKLEGDGLVEACARDGEQSRGDGGAVEDRALAEAVGGRQQANGSKMAVASWPRWLPKNWAALLEGNG